ncbi:MAG: DNA polymerase III subunit alpha [Gemmatimonadetes bacterium GWC2_71_10]|nr:MAG: DNA polymerase III subunit alpha [Gemmatimonadetes bacterium GWC2_71_10]
MSFVHLHTHSEYSLLDGANRISDLVDHVAKLGMDSLAITDHGNLFGAWKFHGEAKARGIRPILGFEAYVAFGSRHLRDKPADAPAHYAHLVLLASNREGYKNLIKLTSIGFLEGYYRRPRIDREVIEQHQAGLVCLSACLSGEVALWLRQGNYERAREAAQWHARVFGPGNYWLELQDHGLADEKVVAEGVQRLAAELGLGLVCTNDAHYLRREDAAAHDVLLAIGTGKDLDDPKRFRFEGTESYVKSEAEMLRLFPGRTELLANTQVIANRCEFDFEKRFFLPQFPRPAEYASDDELLIALAEQGARGRYGDPLPSHVKERLDFELGVITKVGYSGYFLITADFIAEARRRGIPVGPGRGSSAGSIVAYATGITNVDPLKYDLLFERFLNLERISPPDIDVDFCEERRGEIIEYVRERYGRSSVGQIVAYGTMKARAALKDVARILKVPPGEADRITKLIPFHPGQPAVSIPEAVERVHELKELIAQNPTYQRVVQYASSIEGLSRHLSVHAAGVVIAPGPLTDYVPVCSLPTKGAGASGNGEDAIVTQYDMVGLEKIGMLKMDFLGLTTLTVLRRATDTIQQRHGIAIDLDNLPLDDAEVWKMLAAGRTAGVFQFESPLATDALMRMRCDQFGDLVATNALVRPGPLDNGMHLVYIRRKRGQEPVRYALPELQHILGTTYGVIVYQEQVMRIANVLAGYSLAEADVLRKAVGKKKAELIREELGKFIERSVARGHPRRIIEELASQIETFGRYGFVKAHAVAYSLIAYQTAWLKAHYPAEFMAALLSSAIGDTAAVVKYIGACRDMQIEVLAPSVNESGWHFTVVADRRIRFGLGAIRNVGRSAIDSILAARAAGPFTSLRDLAARVDLRVCNKRVLEALVASGACDGLGGHRAQLFAALDHIVAEAQLKQAEIAAGQGTLFGDASSPSPQSPAPNPLPPVAEWSEAERLAREKELVGFFVSGHPLNRFEREVKLFGTRTTAGLGEWTEEKIQVAAVVTAVRRQISKKTGAEWAKLQLEDFHGSAEVLCFPEAWKKLAALIVPDGAYLVSGGFSPRDRIEEQAPFIVEDAQPLAELRTSGRVALRLTWQAGQRLTAEAARAVAAVCTAHPGPAPLEVEWTDDTNGGGRARFRSRHLSVALDDDLLRALRGVLGDGAVELVKVG